MLVVGTKIIYKIEYKTPSGSITYNLYAPIFLSLEWIEGGCVAECEQLGIVAFGGTKGQMVINFSQDFGFLYERLIDADNSFLSKRMVQIKNRFMEIVKTREVWPE